MQAVAAASEELSTSIKEIAKQVVRANAVTSTAVTEGRGTTAVVERLAAVAQNIVVQLINAIAAQTNLRR